MVHTTTIPGKGIQRKLNGKVTKGKTARKEIWIGLVGVTPRPGNNLIGDAKGAYVNVLASAKSASEYTDKVERALDEVGLNLIEIENPEPLAERLSKWSVDEEIMMMAETVKKIDSVVFGTFYEYDSDDEAHKEN